MPRVKLTEKGRKSYTRDPRFREPKVEWNDFTKAHAYRQSHFPPLSCTLDRSVVISTNLRLDDFVLNCERVYSLYMTFIQTELEGCGLYAAIQRLILEYLLPLPSQQKATIQFLQHFYRVPPLYDPLCDEISLDTWLPSIRSSYFKKYKDFVSLHSMEMQLMFWLILCYTFSCGSIEAFGNSLIHLSTFVNPGTDVTVDNYHFEREANFFQWFKGFTPGTIKTRNVRTDVQSLGLLLANQPLPLARLEFLKNSHSPVTLLFTAQARVAHLFNKPVAEEEVYFYKSFNEFQYLAHPHAKYRFYTEDTFPSLTEMRRQKKRKRSTDTDQCQCCHASLLHRWYRCCWCFNSYCNQSCKMKQWTTLRGCPPPSQET